MKRSRAGTHVIRFEGEVKGWPGTVAELRISACVACGAAAFAGARVIVQGHGTRVRQLRGPPAPSERPCCTETVGRRYRCVLCKAVMIVLPAIAQPLKHFSGGAIATALTLWGLCGESAALVRSQINDWQVAGNAARGWRSLTRWALDGAQGKLFAGLRLIKAGGSPRELAARVAQALCGWAPIEHRMAEIPAQAFAGAAHVA